MVARYAELICRSNYTFLVGASHPEELVAQAKQLGLYALALTDLDGLYGIVKAHFAAKEHGLKLIIGSELTFNDSAPLVLLVKNLKGYQNLCRMITRGRTSRPKGESGLPFGELEKYSEGLLGLLSVADRSIAVRAREALGDNLFLAVSNHFCAGDDLQLEKAISLSKELDLAMVAVNQVHTHIAARQPLQDVLVCIKERTNIERAGRKLFGNAERTLKSPAQMEAIFSDLPEALRNTVAIADSCTFSLDEIAYQFPLEDVPADHSPSSWLRELTLQGARQHYVDVANNEVEDGAEKNTTEIPPRVLAQLEHELRLINELNYPGYFLTIHSIVQFAKSRGILCQGRGSAANSAVCYCLGITAIDPIRMDLLFERFISRERNEPPDIDVDFEHERREEVLQFVYEKYGRDRAAMVCEVISYRGRLAIRDVGKALGLSLDQVDRLASAIGRTPETLGAKTLAELGLDPNDRTLQLVVKLAGELEGFPRHLSIHTGGFAITRGPLFDLVPIENAAMDGRTVIQWDKDDVAAAGILKVDLLSLGMLTAISSALKTVREVEGRELTLATIPPEDPATYAMLCDADSVGVFQVESRAQMSMLPRLKPKTFYDLVVEVAIIRPGPIIGNAVHPYLRRRDGIDPVTYPHSVFKPILERTLGVTLFQEQVMRLAVAAAGFSLGEADGLRRAMGSKRSRERLLELKQRFITGLARLGLTCEQGEAVFKQFEGFAHYGFPESHAASFALIAYASAYLKRHHPAAFVCGLLNSQPMGFYAPHSLLDDARRHGVSVLAVDVQNSKYDCILERVTSAQQELLKHAPAERALGVRLGMRMVRGLRADAARDVEAARAIGPFRSLYDLWWRTRLSKTDLARLAAADALSQLLPKGSSRREALWHVHALPENEGDLFALSEQPLDDHITLPALTERQRVLADFKAIGACVDSHPVALLRPALSRSRVCSSRDLTKLRAGRDVRVAGMAIVRQRPETAKGMFFMTLEDEHGFANIVANQEVFGRYRRIARQALFVLAHGRIERSGNVVNVKADRLEEIHMDEDLPIATRDFH